MIYIYFDVLLLKIMPHLLSILLIFLFVHCTVFAQQTDTIDVSKNLGQSVFKSCPNQIQGFDIGTSNPININPVDHYYQISVSGGTCHVDGVTDIQNNTLKLEGDGITFQNIRKTPVTPYGGGNWTADVQINKTCNPQISWIERVIYPPNFCGFQSRESHYIGIYKKIYYIPTPPKPTLTSLKAVVKFPESTTLISSGCPNTLAEETQFFYYPNATEDWAVQCGSDGKPAFPGVTLPLEHNYLEFSYRNIFYKPGAVFYARCNDNGCLSDVSAPLGISVQYVNPRCPDEETYIIDNFSRDGSKDYHHYTVETVICNKADNPNCTLGNVFDLLKNNKFNNAPVAGDFPAASLPTITSPLIPLQAHIPLAGSELLYKVDNTPVQNCQHINLPGVFGMGANLAALAAKVTATRAGEAVYDFTKVATDNRFVGNPILQYIDETAHSITNYTRPGHILHPGKVTRVVVDECDRIKVVTIGSGKSFFGNNSAGKFMADRNTNSGTALFQSIDQRVIIDFNRLYR